MSVGFKHSPWLSGACLVVALVVANNENAPQAQATCEVGSFRASYVDKSKNQATRCERSIDYRWGERGPKISDEGKADAFDIQLDADHFHVTWEGRFVFRAATYNFIAETDDGIRVWVDGQQIIDDWQAGPRQRL